MSAAILCHVGNYDILTEMIKRYPKLSEPQVLKVFSCHDESVADRLRHNFENCHVNIVSNRGMDPGGTLHNIEHVISSHQYDDIEYYYVIHTKTDKSWRNAMLDAIFNNDIKFERDDVPFITGAEKYYRLNNRTVNNGYIKDFFSRTRFRLGNELINQIYPDCNQSIMSENELDVDIDFYRFYEVDLNGLSYDDAMRHYENYGINEHRAHNASIFHSIMSKPNFFIAGTCFVANRKFIELFKEVNFDYEYTLLEFGRTINDVKRHTHSWEYIFGFLCYANGGKVLPIIDGTGVGPHPDDYFDKFDIDIYRNCNLDLKWMPDNELVRHYQIYGKNENRITNLRTLFKVQCQLTHNIFDAKVAFFLLDAHDTGSGGYRTLLNYINELYNHGIMVDLYIGNREEGLETYHGLSLMKRDIHDCINVINGYKSISIHHPINYYLGFKLRRNYDIVVANAWQVADAVYKQREKAKTLLYVIQDYESLFYPNDVRLQTLVQDTYKPEFKYYCLSNWLYTKFVCMGFDCFESRIGVDLNLYRNFGLERENAILFSFYSYKPGRMPALMIECMKCAVSLGIKCYCYPDNPGIDDVINLGFMPPNQLAEWYNKISIGVSFSNTNPSRIGYEMKACGMTVFVYDNPNNYVDIPREEYVYIKDVDEFRKKLQSHNLSKTSKSIVPVEHENENFVNFVKQYL